MGLSGLKCPCSRRLISFVYISSDILACSGFKRFDALHLACAEKKADILLTTDDRFLRKANIHQDKLDVTVANPIIWLISITENRGEN